MPVLSVERRISKYEIENKCVLFMDDDKKPLEDLNLGQAVSVEAGGKLYNAEVREFFVEGAFIEGIVFPDGYDFFFDQRVERGRKLSIDIDPNMVIGSNRLVALNVSDPSRK